MTFTKFISCIRISHSTSAMTVMRNQLRNAAAFLILTVASHLAFAQTEWPTIGLLYNTSEVHSLTYRCDPPVGGRMGCRFEQVSVRPKATFADLPERIASARKQYPTWKPSQDDCKMFRDLLGALQGTKTVPKPEALNALTPLEKRDTTDMAAAFVKACDKPSEESYLNVTRLEQERDRRTCRASVHTYQETFRFIPADKGPGSWVADSQPDGPCGIVQLNRFESEPLSFGGKQSYFWKYVARKAITNPNGELPLGGKCSGFDERVFVYDWRQKTHQRTCDYIEFSPL